MIAARIGDDAEPPLDQREILAVLSEQRRGEAIVVEGQGNLRRIVRGDKDRFIRSGGAACLPIQAPSPTRAGSRAFACASLPNSEFLATSVIVTAAISPIIAGGAATWTGCRYGERPTSWPRVAAGLFEQNIECAAEAASIEFRLRVIDCSLQPMQPVGLCFLIHLICHICARSAGARRVFE